MKMKLLACLLTSLLLAACSRDAEAPERQHDPGESSAVTYIVLDESLQQLKKDFNTNEGKVRLLFIVGDTCGICLRGMADLNDAFVTHAQNDDRLLTLVVHVPTLGAEEKHVVPAISLLDGPRVIHYWDGIGKSGIYVGEALETDGIYAWDVWLAYGPGAQWHGEVPPAPEFWMHQLSGLWPELRLDAELFGEKTLALMEQLEEGALAARDADEATRLADGTLIPSVAQPRRFAIKSHIRGAGGYSNLKRISSIYRTGTLTTDAGTSKLVVMENRANGLRRNVTNPAISLPGNIESVIQSTWEMNGPLMDWEEKGHLTRMGGMQKVGPSLTWKLFVKMNSGHRWALFIDSHSGAIVLASHLNEEGEVVFSIRASDFREIDTFSFPYQLEYLDAAGTVVATEAIREISVNLRSP